MIVYLVAAVAEVGVPEIRPVEVLKFNPEGSEGEIE